LPLRLDARNGGSLTLDPDPSIGEGVNHVFVLRVEKGKGSYRYLPHLRPGEAVSGVLPRSDQAQSLAEFTKTIANDLASRLEASGLYAKEARAMVNTWMDSYFQTEGTRVLFVLSQTWTDAFIPMDVYPQPKQAVRVMVGRVELLSHEREQLAEAAIGNLASADPAQRGEAFAYLSGQGRYVEPIIRRVLRTSTDEKVRHLCSRLLNTEFVTELRAAVHNAADGKRLTIDPLLLRAHLARLLREIGLDREARAEGVVILREVERNQDTPVRPEENRASRSEVRAAALEATGIDRAAAAAYEDCIRAFANSVQGELNTGHIAWCREWWVGRAYARSVVRTGMADQVIRQLGATLADVRTGPDPCKIRQSRLLLAYLHEAKGNQAMAERVWTGVNSEALPRAASAPGPGVVDQTAAR
jgi:hypothetical protein